MSLDVRVIRNARYVHRIWRVCERYDHYAVYNEDFPDRLSGMKPGCYETSAPSIKLISCSCTYYNIWRNNLSMIVFGVEAKVVWDYFHEYAGRPFADLVNMSDQEGAFGTAVCRKLEKDFRVLSRTVEEKLRTLNRKNQLGMSDKEMDDWLTYYKLFHNSFLYANENGVVIFR